MTRYSHYEPRARQTRTVVIFRLHLRIGSQSYSRKRRDLSSFLSTPKTAIQCDLLNHIMSMPPPPPPPHPHPGAPFLDYARYKPPPISATTSTDRTNFVLFIKIFFKYIEKTNMESIRRRVKAIIAECTYRNRHGDPEYIPLQDAIETRLRQCVGEIHWSRAQRCYDVYCARKFWKLSQPTTTLLEAHNHMEAV